MNSESILVVNAGSATLKIGIYQNVASRVSLLYDVLAEKINSPDGGLTVKDASGKIIRTEKFVFKTQSEALEKAAVWLRDIAPTRIAAIGHRVVHGGPKLITHQLITADTIAELRTRTEFAPLHIPIELELIECCLRTYQSVPQFACFDTVFHSTLPEVSSHLAIPQNLFNDGIKRYGFHGLSYESIVHQLGRDLPSRLVVAHLGSGASLAAIRDGKSIDTTMGFTPTGGIPMATRSGDIDPGVLLYLMRVKKLDGAQLEEMFDHKSGLAGLSCTSGDMRELESATEKSDDRAELAIHIFCTAVQKMIGAYATVLGGIDVLVFTGGIGENSSDIRGRICRNLAFLGIALEKTTNDRNESIVSVQNSRTQVRVIKTLEDEQIAHHCLFLMRDEVVSKNENNLQAP